MTGVPGDVQLGIRPGMMERLCIVYGYFEVSFIMYHQPRPVEVRPILFRIIVVHLVAGPLVEKDTHGSFCPPADPHQVPEIEKEIFGMARSCNNRHGRMDLVRPFM